MRQLRRCRSGENPGSGEDSFLDIVSNMVGILIILVMIAGVRLGDAVPNDEPKPIAAEEPVAAEESIPVEEPNFADDPILSSVAEAESAPGAPTSVPEAVAPEMTTPEPAISESPAPEIAAPKEPEPPKIDPRQMARYVQAASDYLARRGEITTLQSEVNRLNEQAELLKARSAGSQGEYAALMGDVARLEALIERTSRQRSDEENERLKLAAELERLKDEAARLSDAKTRLASVKPKSTLLENVPTPLTKKIEGKEAVFALRGGKVSYVPIGEFSERVRGVFRSMRDIKDGQIDETIGPVDGYRFRFLASLHKVRTDEGTRMTVVFDGGEFLPTDPQLGETVESALTSDSAFRRKLALFLKDSSTVTLAVYPDSFAELRAVKKYLLENGYSIALRPMPTGKNVVISPNGTESTAY